MNDRIVTKEKWLEVLELIVGATCSKYSHAPGILVALCEPNERDWEAFAGHWMPVEYKSFCKVTVELSRKTPKESRACAVAELISLVPEIHAATEDSGAEWLPWAENEGNYARLVAVSDVRMHFLGQGREALDALLRFDPSETEGQKTEGPLLAALQYFEKYPLAWSALPVSRLLSRIRAKNGEISFRRELREALGHLLVDSSKMYRELVACQELLRAP